VRYLLLVVLTMLAGPALAEQPFPAGKSSFSVSDGDTVKYGKQLVRMFGIDAPEKGQTCDDGAWLPGPLAKKALIDFIGGRPVACYQVDYDKRNNRPVARCFAGDDDLQALMVSAGWAWAYTQFSDQYASAEQDAIARKVGVHAHRCMPPWAWRARQRADSKLR
jgi:endonuclease YncB( thermonuclease family)